MNQNSQIDNRNLESSPENQQNENLNENLDQNLHTKNEIESAGVKIEVKNEIINEYKKSEEIMENNTDSNKSHKSDLGFQVPSNVPSSSGSQKDMGCLTPKSRHNLNFLFSESNGKKSQNQRRINNNVNIDSPFDQRGFINYPHQIPISPIDPTKLIGTHIGSSTSNHVQSSIIRSNNINNNHNYNPINPQYVFNNSNEGVMSINIQHKHIYKNRLLNDLKTNNNLSNNNLNNPYTNPNISFNRRINFQNQNQNNYGHQQYEYQTNNNNINNNNINNNNNNLSNHSSSVPFFNSNPNSTPSSNISQNKIINTNNLNNTSQQKINVVNELIHSDSTHSLANSVVNSHHHSSHSSLNNNNLSHHSSNNSNNNNSNEDNSNTESDADAENNKTDSIIKKPQPLILNSRSSFTKVEKSFSNSSHNNNSVHNNPNNNNLKNISTHPNNNNSIYLNPYQFSSNLNLNPHSHSHLPYQISSTPIPLAKIFPFTKMTPEEFSKRTSDELARKKNFCNCKRSKCLKLYCECFANGEYCINCNCSDCSNIIGNDAEKEETFKTIKDKNPIAMKLNNIKELALEEIPNDNKIGCNCTKSNCSKKYCECYKAGVQCSEICRCRDCSNASDKCREIKKKSRRLNSIVEEDEMIYNYNGFCIEKISVLIEDKNISIDKIKVDDINKFTVIGANRMINEYGVGLNIYNNNLGKLSDDKIVIKEENFMEEKEFFNENCFVKQIEESVCIEINKSAIRFFLGKDSEIFKKKNNFNKNNVSSNVNINSNINMSNKKLNAIGNKIETPSTHKFKKRPREESEDSINSIEKTGRTRTTYTNIMNTNATNTTSNTNWDSNNMKRNNMKKELGNAVVGKKLNLGSVDGRHVYKK